MANLGTDDETDTTATLPDGAVIDPIDPPTSDDGEVGEVVGEAHEVGAGSAADDGDEVVITIGDEAPPAEDEEIARAPAWVRELRKSDREKTRKLREYEGEIARLKGGAGAQPVAITLGPEPSMDDPDIDYDADKFKAKYAAWLSTKATGDRQKAEREAAQKAEQAVWMARLDAVNSASSSLKVKDYSEAEQAFEDAFSQLQRGIILGGLDDPKSSAMIRYALGKNPKMAKELAAITDPVKFAIRIGKLEDKLKVTPRKSAPPPERVIKGSALAAGAVDSTLDRLYAEAAKTGDLTKVNKYKRDKRAAQAA
jgi:hypothetical protein